MITGEVKVKVTGWQTLGCESDTVTVEEKGICRQVAEGYEIQYIEKPADDVEVENRIIFLADKVVVSKRGMIESEMFFIPEQKTQATYKTPYGVIDMTVGCESISVSEEKDENMVIIAYSMYSGEQLVSYCKTLIEITEWNEESV